MGEKWTINVEIPQNGASYSELKRNRTKIIFLFYFIKLDHVLKFVL